MAKAIAPKIMEPSMSKCDNRCKGSKNDVKVGGNVISSRLESNLASGGDLTQESSDC